MKKTILLLAITIAMFSCSKSDNSATDANKQLTPSAATMAGDWEYVTVIKTNGTTLSYSNLCSTKNDYLHIFDINIFARHFRADCSMYEDESDNIYFEGNKIKNALAEFNNARVTSLTASTMKIESESEHNINNNFQIVAFTLKRK